MNPRAALAEAAFYFAAALIVGGLAHFALVLSIPLVATHDAYERLAAIGPVDSTLPVPRAGPRERLLAYADPAVASALCFFDLKNGPIRVRAPLGRACFCLAVVSQPARRGVLRLDRPSGHPWHDGGPDRDPQTIARSDRTGRRGQSIGGFANRVPDPRKGLSWPASSANCPVYTPRPKLRPSRCPALRSHRRSEARAAAIDGSRI